MRLTIPMCHFNRARTREFLQKLFPRKISDWHPPGTRRPTKRAIQYWEAPAGSLSPPPKKIKNKHNSVWFTSKRGPQRPKQPMRLPPPALALLTTGLRPVGIPVKLESQAPGCCPMSQARGSGFLPMFNCLWVQWKTHFPRS